MKKSVIKIFSQICATVFLLTCLIMCTGNPSVSLLEKAEDCMEEYPDSSLMILRGIAPSSLHSKKHKAKYALLLTQALVKNDSVITSDSLIRQAVNYYSKHPNSPDLMKSAFYHAEVLRGLENITEAVKTSTQAYNIAQKLNDPYWIAKSAEQLMFIFNAGYNREEAAKYSKIASEFYAKAGRRLNHLYSLCDYALDLISTNHISKAAYLSDSLINIVQREYGASPLLGYVYQVKFIAAVELNDFNNAEKCYKNILALSHFISPSIRVHINHAIILSKKGNDDLAFTELKQIEEKCYSHSDKASLFEAYINLYKSKGDFYNAACYLDSALTLQNESVHDILKRDVVLSQKDYYDSNYRVEHKKSLNYKKLIISCAVLFICFILMIMCIYRMNIKRKNKKIESKVKDLFILSAQLVDTETEKGSLQKQLHEKEQENNSLKRVLDFKNSEQVQLKYSLNEAEHLQVKLKSEISSLFKNQWNILNMLCYEYLEKGDSESTRSSILKSVEDQIRKINNPKSIKAIEDSVNKYMNNIIIRLRQECRFLKEADLNFLTLICAGFSQRSICFLLNIKQKNYYAKKQRLILRIINSDNIIKDEIRDYI